MLSASIIDIVAASEVDMGLVTADHRPCVHKHLKASSLPGLATVHDRHDTTSAKQKFASMRPMAEAIIICIAYLVYCVRCIILCDDGGDNYMTEALALSYNSLGPTSPACHSLTASASRARLRSRSSQFIAVECRPRAFSLTLY